MWQPSSPTEQQRSSSTAAKSNADTRQKVAGRRVAQVIRLKKECVEEYKACHARVWREVLKQIKDCNMEDYSIWYDDTTGLLFASFKYVGYDYKGDMERMGANPRVREWWTMTDRMQESLVEGAISSEAGEPSWWKPVEEVFFQP